MEPTDPKFKQLLQGYIKFRNKFAISDQYIMQHLAHNGQNPKAMVIACSDSRVDPALILQCTPGDLFVVRNVANIVPPYEKDEKHHGTSAALEFAICFLKINHLILLGHSQCGGIEALLNQGNAIKNDFINNWVSVIKSNNPAHNHELNNTGDIDNYAKLALKQSLQNCMSFPWIKNKVINQQLFIHLWFFDIKTGLILSYTEQDAWVNL
jgi:carbonic anhydrase